MAVPVDWNLGTVEPGFILVAPPHIGGSLSVVTDDHGFATEEALQQELLALSRKANPDTVICAGPAPAAVPGGPPDGLTFTLCYTAHHAGEAFDAVEIHVIGVDSGGGDGAGSGTTSPQPAFYSYKLLADSTEIDDLAAAASRLPPPTWKLYAGG